MIPFEKHCMCHQDIRSLCAKAFAYFDVMHLCTLFRLHQVVSYDFKEARFASLHRNAIAFPASRFFFVGTPTAESLQTAAREGEAKASTPTPFLVSAAYVSLQ